MFFSEVDEVDANESTASGEMDIKELTSWVLKYFLTFSEYKVDFQLTAKANLNVLYRM